MARRIKKNGWARPPRGHGLPKRPRDFDAERDLHEWAMKTEAPPHDRLSIDHLLLSVRIQNALSGAGIITIKDLCSRTPGQLIDQTGLNGTELEQIQSALTRWELQQAKPEPREPKPQPKPAPVVITARP